MLPDCTHILNAINAGDPQAAGQLLPLVYDELRKLAGGHMAHEAAGNTLNPTALVHEAYLRLVGPAGDQAFANRRYFFAAAAEAMRRILVDRARARLTRKRGGGQQRVDLEAIPAIHDSPMDQMLDIDAALERLSEVDVQAAELVKLRYFAGFTVEEASETLGLSLRSTHRLWGYAKAWLYDALRTIQNNSDQ
ncbi:MAG TPA: sigma-70 family RNA polymerase sigma factor [Gemmatales bacterium]|nr:sigma-70 family RNA polymerase sigma factor [Gemmatales bacterium]